MHNPVADAAKIDVDMHRNDTANDAISSTTTTPTKPKGGLSADGNILPNDDSCCHDVTSRSSSTPSPTPTCGEHDEDHVEKSSRFFSSRLGNVVKPLHSRMGPLLHHFAVARHRAQVALDHPLLSRPLLGRFLSDWIININIIELIMVIAVVLFVMVWGQGHKWGTGAAWCSAFAIAATPRNAFFTHMLGISFDRMIKYHRWLGYFLLVPLLVHTLVYRGFTPCDDVTRDYFWNMVAMKARAGQGPGGIASSTTMPPFPTVAPASVLNPMTAMPTMTTYTPPNSIVTTTSPWATAAPGTGGMAGGDHHESDNHGEHNSNDESNHAVGQTGAGGQQTTHNSGGGEEGAKPGKNVVLGAGPMQSQGQVQGAAGPQGPGGMQGGSGGHRMHRIEMLCWCNNKYNLSGVLPVFAYFVIFLTSLDFVRRRFFESFYLTHFLFLVYAGGSLWHSLDMTPHFVIPLAFYGLDRIIRLVQDIPAGHVMSVETYPGNMVRLTVKGSSGIGALRYRAGQYAFINIPSASATQWHPMSISSSPTDDVITFHVRGVGTWSRALEHMHSVKNNINPIAPGTVIRMNGGYGRHIFSLTKVDTLLLVGGGSGAAPMVSILKYLHGVPAQKRENWALKRVCIVWTVRSREHVTWFARELAEVCGKPNGATSTGGGNVEFEVRVHVTGAAEECARGQSDSAVENGTHKIVPESLAGCIYAGRPQFDSMMEKEAERCMSSLGENTKHVHTRKPTVGVAVCGPGGLVWDTCDAARRANGKCGGVVFVTNTETFLF